VGFSTSLGFAKKLERIIADPHVALAYHTREHGFSASSVFVLAQGLASVDLRPSRSRLEAMVPQGERFMGQFMRGPVWDRLLREYYYERVFVDIAVRRVATWPDLSASGDLRAFGVAWPGPPGPQVPPKNGTGPRVDVDRDAGRIGMLPHRVLAYRGADGFPVVVPVEFAGPDMAGCSGNTSRWARDLEWEQAVIRTVIPRPVRPHWILLPNDRWYPPPDQMSRSSRPNDPVISVPIYVLTRISPPPHRPSR
jgi:hypothetical protein